jgi:hypothetical protein
VQLKQMYKIRIEGYLYSLLMMFQLISIFSTFCSMELMQVSALICANKVKCFQVRWNCQFFKVIAQPFAAQTLQNCYVLTGFACIKYSSSPFSLLVFVRSFPFVSFNF